MTPTPAPPPPPPPTGTAPSGTAPRPLNEWPINAQGDEITLAVPTDILCSFFYFKGEDMAEIASWGTRVIGDSGAFSAMTSGQPVDREEFHAWAARWSDSLLWTAALDVIGDPAATHANWRAARADGLDLVPTVHYGASPAELGRYVEEGVDLIGLGGMVAMSSEPDRLMRWLIPMFRWARDNAPDLRFHGWGISHPRLVDPLPWWSVDSSGFASVFRFGTLRLWLPQRARFVSVDMDGHSIKRYARTLREFYGVRRWQTVAVSNPQTRREVGRLAYKSLQLYVAWLQDRQQVTPPASLRAKLERGPLAAAVQGYPNTAQQLPLKPLGPLAAGVVEGTTIRRDGLGPHLSYAQGASFSGQRMVIDPVHRPVSAASMGRP